MKQVHEGSRGTSKAFFLNDEPLPDLKKNDAFGHARYSRVLLEILERTHTRTSYAIGLFGKLGVGKTTILNEFARLLSESSNHALRHSYTLVKLDAWRYSEANFRREFLLDLAQKFNCRQKIRDLIAKRVSTSRHEYQAPSWKSIFRGAIMVAIIIGASALLAHFQANSETRFIITMTGILLAGLTAVAGSLGEIFKPVTVVEEAAPPVHPDEFGEIFQKVLEKTPISKKNHRLIIAIDNLDRVPEEVVMQVLGAVKSFLNCPKCVYVLPCDEKGLRRHIRESRSKLEVTTPLSEAEATEYLRKFFQVTLTIRDLLEEDLEAFIDRTLAQLPFLPSDTGFESAHRESSQAPDQARANRDAVGLVFRVASANNPRQVLHLANKLAASYLLAVERGKKNERLRNTVLENLGFLAKLVVIEERWPAFYRMILSYPDTLRHLRMYFLSEDKELLPYPLKEHLNDGQSDERTVAFDWKEGLEGFLRRTSQIHSDHVSDFLFLKERAAIARISNFHAFRDAALSSNIRLVVETMSDGITDPAEAVAELLRELHRRYAAFDIPACVSIVSCLVHAGTQKSVELDCAVLDRMAAAVAEILSKRGFASHLTEIGLTEALTLLERRQDSDSVREVIRQLIATVDAEQKPEEAKLILSELVRRPPMLTQGHQKAIAGRLSTALDNKDRVDVVRELALNALESWENPPCQILPRTLWEKSILMLASPGEVANEALEFIQQFVGCLDSQLLNDLCESAYTKLGPPTPNPAAELALRVLRIIPTELVPAEATSPIARGLTGSYPATANQDERWKIVEVFFDLLPAFGEDQRGVFLPRLVDYVAKANIEGIERFLERMEQATGSSWSPDKLHEAVRKRVGTFVREDSVRPRYYRFVEASDARNQIARLVEEIWMNPSVAWGKDGIAAVLLAEADKQLSRAQFRNLVETLIERSKSIPDGTKEEALGALGGFSANYTQGFLQLLVDKLLNIWLSTPRVFDRQAGVALWQGIRKKASRERERFHERVLEFIKQASNANSVAQPHERILVELILDEWDLLKPTKRTDFVDVALRLVEDGRPEEVRAYGHEVLRSLSSWAKAKERVPERVMSLLERQHDDLNTRNNLSTIQAYRAQLPRNLARRLDAYLQNNADKVAVKEFQAQQKPST